MYKGRYIWLHHEHKLIRTVNVSYYEDVNVERRHRLRMVRMLHASVLETMHLMLAELLSLDKLHRNLEYKTSVIVSSESSTRLLDKMENR